MRFDCPYCRHDDARVYKGEQELRSSEGSRDVYQCNECGTLYPRPRMSQELNRKSFELNGVRFDHSACEKEYVKQIGPPSGGMLYELLRDLNLQPGETCLDIGCFDGVSCFRLAQLGLDVYGIEPQQSAVKFCRSKGHKVYRGLFPDDVPADTAHKSYSLITAFEVIYYWTDLKKGLDRARDLLRDEGWMLIKCHQGKSNFYSDGRSLFCRYGDQVQAIPTMDSFRHCLGHSGFTIERMYSFPEDYVKNYWGVRLPGRIHRFLNRRHPAWVFDLDRADRLVVLARKNAFFKNKP